MSHPDGSLRATGVRHIYLIIFYLLHFKEFSWMGVYVCAGVGSIPGTSKGFLLSETRLEISFTLNSFLLKLGVNISHRT